jgi:hypothetical protein
MIALNITSSLKDYDGRKDPTYPITAQDYLFSAMEEQASRSVENKSIAERKVEYLEDSVIYVLRLKDEDLPPLEAILERKLPSHAKIVMSLNIDKNKTMTMSALDSMGGIVGMLSSLVDAESLDDLKDRIQNGGNSSISVPEHLSKNGVAIKEYIFRRSMASVFEFARTGESQEILNTVDGSYDENVVRSIITPDRVECIRRSIMFNHKGDQDLSAMNMEAVYYYSKDWEAPITMIRRPSQLRMVPPLTLGMSSMAKGKRKPWFNELIALYPSLGRGWQREQDLQVGALDAYMALPDDLKENLGTI